MKFETILYEVKDEILTLLPKNNLERWQPYPMQRGPNR